MKTIKCSGLLNLLTCGLAGIPKARGCAQNVPLALNIQLRACWLVFLLGAGALRADELVLQSPCVQTQRFSFVFNAQTNITYSVQYATTLAPPNWATALSVVGSNGPVAFADPAGMGQARFYRVVEGALTVPAAEVRAVASGLYDQIQQQQAVDPAEVSLLFSVFGISTVGSSNDTAFEAAIAAEQPFMLDFQVQAIANKLSQSWFVSWDSFIAQMAGLGAVDNSGQPLSRSYLSAQLAPLLTNDTYQYSELLPALVLALGQERASRSGGATDAVLGDDLLDPIQFNLMFYGCAMLPLEPGPGLLPKPSPTTTHRPKDSPGPTLSGWAGKFGPGLVRGAATGWIGDEIGFPLGYKDSPQAVVCASMALYSYDVQVTPDPARIWQRSNPAGGPYQSQIIATVNFNFPENVAWPAQIALWVSGCDFPQNGAQNNVPVEWELTLELPQHGSLVQSDTVTWNGGQAKATYQAIDEPVPPALQAMTSPSAAIGYVYMRVLNVLPKWPQLETIVRLGNPSAAAGESLLTVYYYKWPQLTLTCDSELSNTNADLDSRILATGVALQLVQTAQNGTTNYTYQGQTQETYAYFHCPTEGEDPGLEVSSLVGGQFQAAIDAPPDLTAATLQVMVDIGKPQENLLAVAPGGSFPITYASFLDMWAIVHAPDEVTDLSSPYAGRYAISGWQPGSSASTLVRQYNSPVGDINENTAFTLVGSPAP
jgi:hypothetical protein